MADIRHFEKREVQWKKREIETNMSTSEMA